MGIRKLSLQKVTGTTGGASALNDLTDVNAGSPNDGDVLTWDTGTSKWIAAASVGGPSASVSPSASQSASSSASQSPSASQSASLSASQSPSASTSPSGSPSATPSASAGGGGDTVTLGQTFPAYNDADIGLWPVAPLVFAKRRRWEASATAMFGGGSLTVSGASSVATTPSTSYGEPGYTPHIALTSTTTLNDEASVRQSNGEWDMGDTVGGWFMHVRFTNPETGYFKSDSRLFVGMNLSGAVMVGSTDPSSLTDVCGLALDAADTYFQFIHNDNSGTATKIATTLSDSLTRYLLYDFFMYCPPGGGAIKFKLQDCATQTNYGSSTATTDLPRGAATAGSIYTPHCFISNGSAGTTTRLDIMLIDIQAPY